MNLVTRKKDVNNTHRGSIEDIRDRSNSAKRRKVN